MSDLSIVVAPGITLQGSYTIAELNKLGLPTIQLTGTVGAANIATGAITAVKVTPDAYWFAVDEGVPNALEGTYSPAVTALANGMVLAIQSYFVNTGPCTFQPNGLAVKSIKKCGGSRELDAGDIRQYQILTLRYHSQVETGGVGYWEMMSLLGNAPKDYPMQGASALGRGLSGLAPEPQAGDQAKFLRGDATYEDPTARINALVALYVGATLELFKNQNFR